MKIVGIVGSNADLSYNRLLLKFIGKKFGHLFDFELLEITDVPLFNQSQDATNSPAIQKLNHKIKMADDWLEQATAIVEPAVGRDYVKLDRGLLTVDQLNYFLDSMPMELTYADSNNQFLYYNQTKPANEMLAPRVPGQVGNPLAKCHPEKAYQNVEWVIQQLRSGATDVVRVHVPKQMPEKYIVHNYQAMHDKQGNYMGINEYILDFKPIVEWYLQQTGQKLVGDVDGVTSASKKNETPAVDGVSSASKKDAASAVSAVTPTPAVDGISSASKKD